MYAKAKIYGERDEHCKFRPIKSKIQTIKIHLLSDKWTNNFWKTLHHQGLLNKKSKGKTTKFNDHN